MKKRMKKGFTIVELVIVIAVIAVLAAVLIPTFASLINKANESKDTQLVRNLNVALITDENEHPTMQSALDAAEKFGYDVSKINASATNNEILWDSKNDVFCYLKDGNVTYIPETSLAVKNVSDWYYWKISDKIEGEYSIYYTGNEEKVTITTGFDSGTSEGISSVYYENLNDKKDVVIRTNEGTNLKINAPQDVVSHYGVAEEVTIDAVAGNSYHEFGIVNSVLIRKGRFYAESYAEIQILTADPAENTQNSVILEAAEEAKITTAVLTNDTLGPGKGVLAIENKLPASIEVKDDFITTENQETLTQIGREKFGGGLGTMNNPFIIKNYDHLKNMMEFVDNYYAFKQTEDIVIESSDLFKNSVSFNGIYDGDGHSIKVDHNLEEMAGVVLFKAGNRCVIKNLVTYSAQNCLMSVVGLSCENYKDSNSTEKLSLINIQTKSEAETVFVNSSNVAPFISDHAYFATNTPKEITVSLENCVNYINIENTGTGTCTGVFWGGCPWYGINAVDGKWVNTTNANVYRFSLKNCSNRGNISGDSQVGLIFGNSSGVTWGLKAGYTIEEIAEFITLENVSNYGVLSAIKENGSGVFTGTMNSILSQKVGGTGKYTTTINVLKDKTVQLYHDGNGIITIVGADLDQQYTYKLHINVPPLVTRAGGSLQGRSCQLLISEENILTEVTEDLIAFNRASNHTALTYEELAADWAKEPDNRQYNIDPAALSYDYLFENYCHMAIHISDEGVVTVVCEQKPDGDVYPYFDGSRISSFVLCAYDKSGTLVGKISV